MANIFKNTFQLSKKCPPFKSEILFHFNIMIKLEKNLELSHPVT